MPQDNQDVLEEEQTNDENDDHEKVSIRCHLFFDGTLNNRTNVEQRLLAAKDDKLTEQERAAAQELKNKTSLKEQQQAKLTYQAFGGADSDDSNSYEGYFTNIALLDRYADKAKEYDVTVKSYIEGAGSVDMDDDIKNGYAFGKGDSGVKKKVDKGLEKVVVGITENVPANKLIKKITLDVFGFSRGAASARYFIYQALYSENSLAEKLEANNYKVRKVEICFAGLFDTVSTYGYSILLGLANNVSSLQLDSVRYAKQTIHLTSADEHRKYFSLTNIRSAQGDSREIFLPGVHSDIGGGYRDKITEQQIVFQGGEFELEDAKKERAALIEAGWYRDDEIKLLQADEEEEEEFIKLEVNRKGIRNHYSRIPLHIMARFARKREIKINTKLELVEEIPASLKTLKDTIEHYIQTGKKSEAKHWHGNLDWLRQIRHDYFHFSARHALGHIPRYSKGRRYRKVYNG